MNKCPFCNQEVKVIISNSGSQILVNTNTTKHYLWMLDKDIKGRYKIVYGLKSHSESCLMKGKKKNANTVNMSQHLPAQVR